MTTVAPIWRTAQRTRLDEVPMPNVGAPLVALRTACPLCQRPYVADQGVVATGSFGRAMVTLAMVGVLGVLVTLALVLGVLPLFEMVDPPELLPWADRP